MARVTRPQEMNATFARLVNAGDLDQLLDLYEPNAIVRIDAERTFHGAAQIAQALRDLIAVPGTITSENVFCIERDEIALLRADYVVDDENGSRLLSGRTAEVVRRGADGGWRYVIDHAAGASLPPVFDEQP